MARTPDFFLVGAPKCGTTSMYQYLRAHPDVFIPRIKEPHYFGSDLDIREERKRRSLEEYKALFDAAERFRRVGECSVHYLRSTVAAQEIHDFNPGARILIMVREPVSAMVSWHGQLVSMLIEDIYDFEKAVRAQDDRIEGRRLPNTNRMHQSLQYTDVFSYPDQVQRYFDVFGRERVHVIVLDDMMADLPATYRRVLEFLDIDPAFAPDFDRYNEKKWLRAPAVTRALRRFKFARRFAARAIPDSMRRKAVSALSRIAAGPERPPVRPEFVDELRAACKPDVDRLGAMLGRDLSHWYAPRASLA